MSNEATAVLKVSVLRDGRVLVEGEESTLEEIEQRFKGLKSVDGVVWYYREGADEEPHPIASEVIQLVINERLPIALFNESDFSGDPIEANP